jgi:glycerol kinase
MQIDSGIELKELRADGGAIANDFMAQFQADILGVPLLRPKVQETTAQGAAYLAGLAVGFWKDQTDITKRWAVDREFKPSMTKETRDDLYEGWQQAVNATMGFKPRK